MSVREGRLDPQTEALGDALSGAVAGMFSLLVMYPLDTFKSRQQLVGKVQHTSLIRYYDGLGIGLVSDGAQQASYYYFYTLLKKLYTQHYHTHPSTSAALTIGSVAGALNMILTSPLSTIHTRMQTCSLTSDDKPTVINTAKEIVQSKGVLGLWSGLRTSLILVVNPSITFFAFETLKRYLQKLLTGKAGGSISSGWLFLLGAVAKLIATMITYPLILAKTRLQTDKERKYRGIVHVFGQVMKQSGIFGVYAGMNSKLLQTCLSSAIKFAMKDVFDKFAFGLIVGNKVG